MIRPFLSAAAVTAVLAVSGFVAAQPGDGGPRSHRGPPPNAYDACSGSDDDAPCTFDTPRGQESGKCAAMGDGREACLPSWAPHPPRREARSRAEEPAPQAETAIHPVPDSEPDAAPAAAPTIAPAPAPAPVAAAPAPAPLPIPAPAPVAAAATVSAPVIAASAPLAPLPAPAAPAPEPAPASDSWPWPIVLSVLAGAAALYGIQRIRSSPSTAPLPVPPTVPSPLTSSPTIVDLAVGQKTPLEPPAPSAATAPLPRSAAGPNGGALVGGSYEIKRELGKGGMGVVFEAMDLSLDRRVALKKMRPEIAHNARARERFLAEAKTVAKLQHANIVGIHAIIEEAGDLYLVFEYVDGSTLDDILDRQKRLTPAATVKILAGVAEAVDYAHAHRVIHRDLKPANIMIDREGRAKVMDFGIAHQAKITVSQLTQVEAFGTMAYMPPEQELGQAVRESDVYAFAAVTYETLTGGLPFPGPNFHLQKVSMTYRRPSEADPPLPRPLDAIFERALQPEPKRRYPTTGEFVRTLQGAIAAS